MAFDTNSNKYTFLFSIVLVVVVASILALAAESLKPLQKKNESREKMQNILASVGIEVSADNAEAQFGKYITDQIILDAKGMVKEGSSITAFNVDVLKEYKSGLSKVYTANKDDLDNMTKMLLFF